jgi:hypothetical protein
MEGTSSALAYLGSANFTAHGWGFLGGQPANVEAGLILRRSVQAATMDSLLPDLVGEPILLANGNLKALRAPENGPGDDPWPDFIKRVLLSPVAKGENDLELLIEIAPASNSFLWSAKLPDKDGVVGEILVPADSTQDSSKLSFHVPLSPQTLTILMTEQEILICWTECPNGRRVPLNIESTARALLPISPGNQRVEESHLLSYYQGRISWEELFPDPDVAIVQSENASLPAAPVSGVDKSRIQSYQIREFVEALTGLRQDLQAANQSEPSMRLALLGPVSPVALAQAVFEAAKMGRRTPTAAAFQLVEILACLISARSFGPPERLHQEWRRHVDEALNRTTHLLQELFTLHGELASNKAFHRYQKAVLADESSREL